MQIRFYKYPAFLIGFILLPTSMSLGSELLFKSPSLWSKLDSILLSRVKQPQPKMKLQKKEAEEFILFLNHLNRPLPHLQHLQSLLPKTTIELLIAINKRGLDSNEAEKMAQYLNDWVTRANFANLAAFDENTSHIIGREWSEIDYSGENMTWEAQKKKYEPYGILHFKSLDCLSKFLPVESKLPYYIRIYKPQNKK